MLVKALIGSKYSVVKGTVNGGGKIEGLGGIFGECFLVNLNFYERNKKGGPDHMTVRVQWRSKAAAKTAEISA